MVVRKGVLKFPLLGQGTSTAQRLSVAYDVFLRVRATDPERLDKHLSYRLCVATECCSNARGEKYPSEEAHVQPALANSDTLKNIIVLIVGTGTKLLVYQVRHITGCGPVPS